MNLKDIEVKALSVYSSLALLFTFFIIRYGFEHRLDILGAYSTYTFELLFVALIGWIYRRKLKFSIPSPVETFLDLSVGIGFGFTVYKLSKPLSLVIPFDFKSNETLLFLLLLGPLLEELLFRMAIWEPLSEIFGGLTVLLVTSVIFSYSHFDAWWSVPEQLRSFVLYQTLYVFFLALYCGWRRMKSGNFIPAVLSHASFNFGFYVGFLL